MEAILFFLTPIVLMFLFKGCGCQSQVYCKTDKRFKNSWEIENEKKSKKHE